MTDVWGLPKNKCMEAAEVFNWQQNAVVLSYLFAKNVPIKTLHLSNRYQLSKQSKLALVIDR